MPDKVFTIFLKIASKKPALKQKSRFFRDTEKARFFDAALKPPASYRPLSPIPPGAATDERPEPRRRAAENAPGQ
jgi:hypothetical protein